MSREERLALPAERVLAMMHSSKANAGYTTAGASKRRGQQHGLDDLSENDGNRITCDRPRSSRRPGAANQGHTLRHRMPSGRNGPVWAEHLGRSWRAEVHLRRRPWRSSASQPDQCAVAECKRRLSHPLALRPRGRLPGSMADRLAYTGPGSTVTGVGAKRDEAHDVAPGAGIRVRHPDSTV